MNKNIIILSIIGILLISGCSKNTHEEAEKVAQGFSIALQNEDYESLYNYFSRDLQKLRSKDNFVKFLSATDTSNFKIVYDKVVLQNDNEAYAYYTFAGNYLYQPKTPAIKLVYSKGKWGLDGFKNYFTDDCVQSMWECSDNNICTEDLCNQNTSFVCKNEYIKDCCNSISDCSEEKPYCHNNVCFSNECLDNSNCLSLIKLKGKIVKKTAKSNSIELTINEDGRFVIFTVLNTHKGKYSLAEKLNEEDNVYAEGVNEFDTIFCTMLKK